MSNKEKLAERWEQGRISEAMLRVYVRKGILSKELRMKQASKKK